MLVLVVLDPLAVLRVPLATSQHHVLPAVLRAQLSCAEAATVKSRARTAELSGAVVGTAISSVWVEALPPAGFVWADESVYSTAVSEPTEANAPVAKTMARVLADNSPLDIISKPATVIKPNPLTSWYDRGERLETASPSRANPLRSGIDIDELMIDRCIGKGTQSEVLLGVLPNIGQVAVKVGIKKNAIAREAPVLSAMSRFPCFPTVLHHEPDGGELAAGGFLIVDVLGVSLQELWQSESRSKCLDGHTFLRLGRGILRPLRQLHLEGFVHNDLKPANLLLGPGPREQSTRLHLIDFGSCTQTEAHVRANGEVLPPSRGAIGTLSFASLAADDPSRGRPMRPADDVEGLVFTLAYLTRGSLPWQGKPDLAAAWKPGLLETSDAAAELTADIPCATATAALEALLAELRRCHADGAELSYDACLAALGGETWSEAEAEADALSEDSLREAFGYGSSKEEAEKAEPLEPQEARVTPMV